MAGGLLGRALRLGGALSISASVALFGAMPVARAAPTEPLSTPHTVALWHMDETSGSTMHDSSGNGHNGTLKNVRLGRAGFKGKAYSFNGRSSEVTVPTSSGFDAPGGGYKITIYVKFTQAPQDYGQSSADIVRKGLTTTQYWKMEISKTGKAACHFTGSSGIADMPGAGPILADGVWHQLVCWKTLNQVRLFVDGTVVASRSVTVGTVKNTNVLTLGYKKDPNIPDSDFYKGLEDEVSIIAYT